MAGRKKAESTDGINTEVASEEVFQEVETKNENDRVSIIKNGVTRIKARAEVQEFLSQGWALK